MLKHLLSWNDVSTGMLILLCIIGIIIHLFIFSNNNNFIRLKIINMLDECIIQCSGDMCKKYTSLRDDGYMNSLEKKNYDRKCGFLGWELSHFIFHMFLGYYYNIYISLPISVGYEIFERVQYNCSSYADLVINFLGLLTGVYIRT